MLKFSAMRSKLAKVKNDPRVLLDRLYYILTGTGVSILKNERDTYVATFSALATLSEMQASTHIECKDIVEMVGDLSEDKDTQDMGRLFEQYGSDKSTKHNYHLIYSTILKGKRDLPLNILEVGIGTNNPSVPSNMGEDGKPGASLRGFRDWGPKFSVHGADIDKDVLFSDERISTYFVDQTNPRSLEKLARKFPKKSFDLIIDDGLHTSWANLNTLIFALDLLKPDGTFVIEDIVDEYIPVWKTVIALMREKYLCELIRARSESLLTISRKG